MYENRKFVIFSVSEINLVDFNQVLETSAQTLRLSTDGQLTFVKYDSEMPSSIQSLTTKSVEYNYQEMLNILSTEAWSSPIQE